MSGREDGDLAGSGEVARRRSSSPFLITGLIGGATFFLVDDLDAPTRTHGPAGIVRGPLERRAPFMINLDREGLITR